MIQRKRRHILITLALMAPLCIGAVIGWNHLWQRPCTQLEITGVKYSDIGSMYRLIDSTLSTQLVVDRLQRHPWIHGVRAVCYPTGTMHIEVVEHLPRLLVLTQEGTPAYYLGESGQMMPMGTLATFDVPLLRGSDEPYHAMSLVENQMTLNLLGLLPSLSSEVDSLISEFELTQDGLTMMMRSPHTNRTSLVRLGHQQWHRRLDRLYTFWNQEIQPHEDRMFKVIDLRFGGQIITQESPA